MPRCRAHMCSRLLLQLQSFKQAQDKPVEAVTSNIQGLIYQCCWVLGGERWYYHILSQQKMMIRQCWIDGTGSFLPREVDLLVWCFSPLLMMFIPMNPMINDWRFGDTTPKWTKIGSYQRLEDKKTWYIWIYRVFLLVTWFLYLF